MGYANPHAVTSVGGTTYTYDNNGNATAIGSLDYTWDWRNRLASAERTGGGVTSYGYDHTGQRVFKATGTATTSYPSRYFNLATTTGAATTTKHIFAPDGTLLATVEGSGVNATTTYLHPDHLGGANVTTDEDGEVTQTLDYYPYGSQRIASGSFAEQRRFIGEESDGDTEFSYLNARYYQGSRGQFLSQDPVFWELKQNLENPQSSHSYSYAEGSPMVKKDPTGRCPTCGLALIGAGAGIAGQFGYDVYSNVQAGGYRNAFTHFSSGDVYLTRAMQGAVVGATGGAAGAFTASVAGQAAIVGGVSGAVGAGGNAYLGQPITAQSIFADTVIGGLTFGAAGAVPKVPGRLPNFGTRAFISGKHTQQSGFRLAVESTSSYLSSLFGNASLGRSTNASVPGSGGSVRSSAAFGITADTTITGNNVGGFINFISQFLK